MKKVLLLEPVDPGVLVRAGEEVDVRAGARTGGGGSMGRAVVCAIDLGGGKRNEGALHQGPGGREVAFVRPWTMFEGEGRLGWRNWAVRVAGGRKYPLDTAAPTQPHGKCDPAGRLWLAGRCCD